MTAFVGGAGKAVINLTRFLIHKKEKFLLMVRILKSKLAFLEKLSLVSQDVILQAIQLKIIFLMRKNLLRRKKLCACKFAAVEFIFKCQRDMKL